MSRRSARAEAASRNCSLTASRPAPHSMERLANHGFAPVDSITVGRQRFQDLGAAIAVRRSTCLDWISTCATSTTTGRKQSAISMAIDLASSPRRWHQNPTGWATRQAIRRISADEGTCCREVEGVLPLSNRSSRCDCSSANRSCARAMSRSSLSGRFSRSSVSRSCWPLDARLVTWYSHESVDEQTASAPSIVRFLTSSSVRTPYFPMPDGSNNRSSCAPCSRPSDMMNSDSPAVSYGQTTIGWSPRWPSADRRTPACTASKPPSATSMSETSPDLIRSYPWRRAHSVPVRESVSSTSRAIAEPVVPMRDFRSRAKLLEQMIQ
jgi:hypothetical protein